jgi:PleD family two-component response regulator
MTMRAMGEVKSPMATRRRIPESIPTASPKPGPRVLIVEDEQDVADLIRYNLAKEGYEVLLVGNGADALKLARESRPDVILLDIMVPQLNGCGKPRWRSPRPSSKPRCGSSCPRSCRRS